MQVKTLESNDHVPARFTPWPGRAYPTSFDPVDALHFAQIGDDRGHVGLGEPLLRGHVAEWPAIATSLSTNLPNVMPVLL